MRSALASFVDHFLRVRVGLRENFLVTLFCFGELFFDFLRIELALLDLAPPLLQYRKDWFVGEAPQKQRHDHKASHLRQEQPRIPAESLGRIMQRFTETTRRSSDDYIHNSSAKALLLASTGEYSVREKEQRIENDRFRKSDGQNSMHKAHEYLHKIKWNRRQPGQP